MSMDKGVEAGLCEEWSDQSVEFVGYSEATSSREFKELNEALITSTFLLPNPLLG